MSEPRAPFPAVPTVTNAKTVSIGWPTFDLGTQTVTNATTTQRFT